MDYKSNIWRAGIDIYAEIDQADEALYIPTGALQAMLSEAMTGMSLAGLPLRTRSKVVKERVCEALGYPVPASFQKTQPRFPGQNFDVYTQTNLNVQIWNEEVDANRRYVFVHPDAAGRIRCIKVLTGDELAQYDRTGTLTRKYQAIRTPIETSQLFSARDTQTVASWAAQGDAPLGNANPNRFPARGELMPIQSLYQKLLPLVGRTVPYLNALQERNRGAALHAMVCALLGYAVYEDDGRYPDIANQLLEVKLQTSPTIDLGLHAPDDGALVKSMDGAHFYSSDVRYAVLRGEVRGDSIVLTALYLVNGEDFPRHFPSIKGNRQNAKRQIRLPASLFDQ